MRAARGARELPRQKFLLHQEPDETPAEHFRHLVEPGERHGDERPVFVETSLHHQAVMVEIPAQLIPKGLMCSDKPTQQRLPGSSAVKLR